MASTETIQEHVAENKWLHYREQDKVVRSLGGHAISIRMVTRVLKSIQRADVDAIKTYLNAITTVPAPLVDSRPMEGVWFYGGLEVREEALGSDRVQTYNLYQKLFQGDYAQAFYTSADNCEYKIETQIYFGASTPPVLPAGADGITHRIVYRDYDSDFGGHLFVVEKRSRKYQTTGQYTSEESAGRTTLTTDQKGVTSDDDHLVPDITQENGKVKQQRINDNNDCSRDVKTDTVTSSEQSGIINRATLLMQSLGSLIKNTLTPTAYVQPSAEGVTLQYRKTPNVDGSDDTEITEVTSPVLPTVSNEKTITEGATAGSGNKNVRTVSLAGETVAVQGTTVDYQKIRKEDGTYDEENRVTTSPILDTYEKTTSDKRTSEGNGIENVRGAAPTPTASSLGTTVRFKRRKNPDGTFTYTEVIDTVNELSNGKSYELTSCRELSRSVIQENILEDLTSEDDTDYAATEGQTILIRLTENPDGTWNREVTTRTAPKTTGTRVEIRADQTVATATAKNVLTANKASEIRSAAEITAYAIIEVVNDENPDCSWDTDRKVITPVALTTGWYSFNDKDGVGYKIAFENQPLSYINDTVLAAFGSNTNNEPSFGINAFGLYTGSATRKPVSTNGSGSVDGNGDYASYTYQIIFDVTPETTYTVEILYSIFQARCITLIDGIPMAQHPGLPVPGVFQVGGSKWKGVKVTSAPTP